MAQAPAPRVFLGTLHVLRSLFRRAAIQTLPSLLLSLGSLVAGAALALHHPLWPMAALAAFWMACLSFAWRPGLWLFWVPAILPALNFSPWSGWIIFEEFDILLLAVLAGGYAQRAMSNTSLGRLTWRGGAGWFLPALLGGSALWALFRGFSDAGGFSFNWFAGYTEALNSVRVFKSLAFALLLWPLLGHELIQSNGRAMRRLSSGVLTGLAIVTLAILWERMAFPGLFNFTAPYRTVGLFWEMHVGGGAIDAYLALTTPFVVWALVTTKRPVVWILLALLALLTGYACLTTFSRGVYLAVASSLGVLYWLLWIQKRDIDVATWWRQVWRGSLRRHWRAKAGLVLCLALLVEIVAVLGGGTFMTERVNRVNRDFDSRIEHWQQGLAFLRGPDDWLLGKGLGRVPAQFGMSGPVTEFSGSTTLAHESVLGRNGNSYAAVAGPLTRHQLGGGYALTQKISKLPTGKLWVTFDIRVAERVDVFVEVCQRHLLFDGLCQRATMTVGSVTPGWKSVSLLLEGPDIGNQLSFPPRSVMLTLSVVNAGGVGHFDNVVLKGSAEGNALSNGDFSDGFSHWFPAAQSYFLPWHLDSLYVEHVVERGVVGFLIFMGLILYAVHNVVLGPAKRLPFSPYLAASLFSVMVAGVAIGVMDSPRVALLLYLMAFCAKLSSENGKAR